MKERSNEEIEHLQEVLDTFRRKGSGRTYRETGELLREFGFSERYTRRNHVIWRWDELTLTLPQRQTLRIQYVKLVIRMAERSLGSTP